MGIILDALGAVYNIASSERNRRDQKAIYEDQKAFQVDMFNRQNAYNDPSAQMDRLQQAGLNPNLIYNKGGALPSATIAGGGTAPNLQPNKLDMQSIYMSRQIKIQERIAEAEIKLKEAQAQKALAEVPTAETQRELMSEQINQLKQNQEFAKDLHELDITTKQISNDMQSYQLELQKLLKPYIELNHQLQNEQIMSNINRQKMQSIFDEYNLKLREKEVQNHTALTYEQLQNLKVSRNLNQQEFDFLEKYNEGQLRLQDIEKESSELNVTPYGKVMQYIHMTTAAVGSLITGATRVIPKTSRVVRTMNYNFN